MKQYYILFLLNQLFNLDLICGFYPIKVLDHVFVSLTNTKVRLIQRKTGYYIKIKNKSLVSQILTRVTSRRGM